MGDRFRHLQHVFRVGVVLGVGLVAFLIARAAAIPSDFGVLGFYRAVRSTTTARCRSSTRGAPAAWTATTAPTILLNQKARLQPRRSPLWCPSIPSR